MAERRPTNLRNVLTFAAVLVTLLATTAALALMLSTSVMKRMTADIAGSVESVRTIEEAEVSLLLHVRATDRNEQQEFATQLRELLDEAEDHVQSPAEASVLAEAKLEVAEYLQLSAQPGASLEAIKEHESRAIDALERLGDLDVAESRAAQARAKRWDHIASVAAVVLGLSIVTITAALVLWLRRRVIRPLFSLASTMKAFGEGNRTVRADESGPIELREMTHSFNDMANSIAAQRQAQTAFLGGVAHDLRNPLTALKLAIELLGPDQPMPAEPQLRRTLGVIGRQITQLERMVGDFLDMAKIEAGTLELKIADHDVRAIVNESLELFAESARPRLRVTMPDEPVMAACDAGRIGQAVTNLVSNAIKYSPPEEPIDVVVASVRDTVTIEITDRGVGIPRDDMKRIFQPFRRGATRSLVPGTGLGLYNVQRIVQAHAGRLDVESIPSVGSTFRIVLQRTAEIIARVEDPAARAS